ncbi:MAG: transposase [Planctomycetaceae bacterium]
MLADLFPSPVPDLRGGRSRVGTRLCVEGILWILRSGARWKGMPKCFPSHPRIAWQTAGLSLSDLIAQWFVRTVFQDGRALRRYRHR